MGAGVGACAGVDGGGGAGTDVGAGGGSLVLVLGRELVLVLVVLVLVVAATVAALRCCCWRRRTSSGWSAAKSATSACGRSHTCARSVSVLGKATSYVPVPWRSSPTSPVKDTSPGTLQYHPGMRSSVPLGTRPLGGFARGRVRRRRGLSLRARVRPRARRPPPAGGDWLPASRRRSVARTVTCSADRVSPSIRGRTRRRGERSFRGRLRLRVVGDWLLALGRRPAATCASAAATCASLATRARRYALAAATSVSSTAMCQPR